MHTSCRYRGLRAPPDATSIGPERESSDPDSLFVEDDDGTRLKVLRDGVEVRQEERCDLVRTALRLPAQSTIEGPAALEAASSSPKSVSAEMTTRPAPRGGGEYVLVGRHSEVDVTDVDRVVACLGQQISDAR